MLTIREPISLKTQRPIQTVREDMAARIQANYGLMQSPIRKGELLHITTEPPEVYFAEGDNIRLFSQVSNEIQQEIRLDVVNNLMNRILAAQTENFTYQDTVYVSSILRKLGIRDEKLFMKQVFALQNEKKESHALLQKYEENRELLQLLFTQEQARKQAEDGRQEMPEAEKQRYYIHDAIFRRLETGRIYQDMRKYSKGLRHDSRQIFRTELHMGEQAAMARNFQLHALRQEITKNEMPLYYYHANRYEFLQELTEESVQALEEQITAAVLLNLIDQSYALRQEQIAENSHNWYSVAGALFQTAENTWKRYEANLTEGKRVSSQITQMLEEVSEARQIEGDTVENIAAEYRSVHQEWKQATALRQMLLQQRNLQEIHEGQVSISGGSYHLTQEELELHYLQQGEDEENEDVPASITAEQLRKQLETLNQRNYENYRKLTEIQQQQPSVKERRLDRRRAQQDALRALENPGEVLREYITAETADPVEDIRRQAESRIYALFSEETKEIYRQYLIQNRTDETTFLQHIMAQSEDDETRQEVVRVLEQVRQTEEIRQVERQIREQMETLQPIAAQDITQELRRRMTVLQEHQGDTVYQKWIQPAELYLQQTEEETTEILREVRTRQEEAILRQTDGREAAKVVQASQDVEETARQTLQHIERLSETEETFRTTQERHTIEETGQRLEELRQTLENRIERYREEQTEALAETQRRSLSRQVELVHKAEEQVISEEMLEEIRLRERTRKEEHREETTVQQNRVTQKTVEETVNHIQLRQTEDIEELIRQNMKKQLGNLSDQVYGRLERKLQMERKRRGYS